MWKICSSFFSNSGLEFLQYSIKSLERYDSLCSFIPPFHLKAFLQEGKGDEKKMKELISPTIKAY